MAKKINRENGERSIENYLYSSDKARMISLVADMTARAKKALTESIDVWGTLDVDRAQQIIEADDVIDDLEEQIDQECLYSIAMRQPVREDLRFVYAVMKIITDIERIADQSVNLSMSVINYVHGYSGTVNSTPPEKLGEIREAGEKCAEMADIFLKAFEEEDEQVIIVMKERRSDVVKLCRHSIRLLMESIIAGTSRDAPASIFIVIDVFRHLKRIADHLINLAEKVYFIATGISPSTLKKQMLEKTKGRKDKEMQITEDEDRFYTCA